MSNEFAPNDRLKKAMADAVLAEAFNKCLVVPAGRYVLVWDEQFKARIYSAGENNFHWSVPILDDVYCRYSTFIDL